jgi:uncharacterized membrane protein HdeD (DUF308 family)
MASPVYTADDAAYWYAPLARAIPAAALCCVITFAGGFYTPEYGLASFGGYAIVAGLLGALLSLRLLSGTLRTVFLIQALVSLVAGVAALVGMDGGLPVLLVVIALWGIVTGFLELYAGIRSRGTRAGGRDWIFVGALTVLLAIVCLVIPPGYSQHYNAPGDGGARVLNASVMVVGALGIYGAIVAVYLAIAGFSLRFSAAAAGKDLASGAGAAVGAESTTDSNPADTDVLSSKDGATS